MEVLSVVSAVCVLCKAIMTWVDEREERNTTIREISSIITQIHSILSPLSDEELRRREQTHLTESIRQVADTLRRTQDHLLVWSYKRSRRIAAFINPAKVIKDLRRDAEVLDRQLMILLTSISVAGYIREHSRSLQTDPMPSCSEKAVLPENMSPAMSDNTEAREFWNDYIGAKIVFVPIDLFYTRLCTWYNATIDRRVFAKITMRLDEYDSGGILSHNFWNALGQGSLKQFIEEYKQDLLVSYEDAAALSTEDENLKTPVLVWIDDNPSNNQYEVAYATQMGVSVIQLTSTAVAKAWVQANTAFLRANNGTSRVRFISDNHRWEKNSMDLNPSAGETFLRFLRGRLFEAPVLIYTYESLPSTQYVDQFRMAGSTRNIDICIQYITDLATGRSGDNLWTGYHPI
ncbi:hypothetical protein B0H34DRAFT_391779 [Crassisporium funariophilum]|nr:hypothetical protein B0H34DRAFT_391779 [Crassisporium funariophilum]